ncbi:hypothetical protein ACLD02_00770 [Alloalcanivorax sp. C16-2]|uniref:hypothetical protein n=1 Tax=Alloalcanivorax sp. C16-2 TaxID=3390052 RepID=UPI0039705E78
MKHGKEALIFSITLSITSVAFLMVPMVKGSLPFDSLSILIQAAIYFVLAFSGYWLGQLIAGKNMVLKPLFWMGPLTFVLAHQVSKLTSLYEVAPFLHFLLVVLMAFIVGWRLPLSPANEVNLSARS